MNISVLQLAKMALDAAERAQKTADDAQQAIAVLSAEVQQLKKEKQIGQNGTRVTNR